MIEANRNKIMQLREILHQDVERKRKKWTAEMEKEGANRREKLLGEAEKKAASILREADEQSERLHRLALAQARFQKNRKLMETRESLIDQMTGELEEKLMAFRSQAEYVEFLKNLILDAVSELSDREIWLCFNEEDGSLYREKLQTQMSVLLPDKKLELSPVKVEIKGGVVAVNRQGNRRVENSFELLLVQAREELGKTFYGMIS